MVFNHRVWYRFRLAAVLVLVLGIGIGIGFMLKSASLQLPFSAPNEAHMATLPEYTIEPPDVLEISIQSKSSTGPSPTSYRYLVFPDGKVDLGAYGRAYVSGLTIEQACTALESHLSKYLDTPTVVVDVFDNKSKTYFIITRGGAAGDEVNEICITGNETVLDGLAHIGGLKMSNAAKIWIERPALKGHHPEAKLTVDFDKIAKGNADTNYQLFPRDRLYISQDSSTGMTN